MLTDLIQAGGGTLEKLRAALPGGAEPGELAQQVDAEIERRIDLLIERGEIAASDGALWREKLLSLSDAPPPPDWAFDETQARAAIAQRDAPSQSDLRQLLAQLERLEAEVAELKE